MHRKLKLALLSLAVAIFSLSASAVKADTVVIGGTDGQNCFPFGTCGYVGPYQQFYSGGQFSSSVFITQVAFASGRLGAAGPAAYIFSLNLSNTSATPTSYSSSYAANRGANYTTVFNGLFAATLRGDGNPGNTFDFVITLTTPFFYDPSQGNLLLEVDMASSTGPGDNFFVAGSSSFTGRNWEFGPNNTGFGNGPGAQFSANYGLLTQFTTQTTIPEPPTVLLLGTGLVALNFRARRPRPGSQR